MKNENLQDKQLTGLDHRQLNRDLEIFFFDEEFGKGLPILLKNGVIIKNLIQEFIRSKEREYNYEEVVSPILANPSLYEKSGHLSHYKEYIFPKIEKESEEFQLRPMTCPHHCMIYGRKIHSYRELPIWLCEHSILHRFEPSGSLKGLERVRWMELSDNHVFATEEQLGEVFKKCFFFILEVFKKFAIKVERFVCSLHSHDNVKYHNDEKLWLKVENLLINSLEELTVDFVRTKDEAAFYGPKLDIEVKVANGSYITLATIQLDFVLPKRFNLTYIGNKGEQITPIIVHYSSIGSYQRFISFLLEQTQGKLPFWLAPVQLVLLPLMGSKNEQEISNLCDKLKSNLQSIVRVEVWKEKRLNYLVRRIHKFKIPSYIVIGEKELFSRKLTFSYEYESQKIELSSSELIEKLREMNSES